MSKEPWIGEKWVVSPYNFVPEVISQMDLPENAEICDVTLRDGEQQTGIVFKKEEKIRIAEKLSEIGVKWIEAGMPAVSKDDFEAIKEISSLGLTAKIRAFSRAKKDDIDLCLAADVESVGVETVCSDILIEKGFEWSREKVLEDVTNVIEYAKDHGLHAALFAADSTRADLNFLKKLVEGALNAGADSIIVVDTLSVASPQAFSFLVKKVKEWSTVPLEVHCHNHLGLGTANSLAGIVSGAKIVHVTVNGMGEGAGNSPLEEVVVALKLLYGIDPGIDLSKLCELSEMVQEISGFRVATNKPIVGKNIFAVESGIPLALHRRFRDKGIPHGLLPYDPELVGNTFKIVFGKKSGRHAIRWGLENLGLTATDEQVKKILGLVKERSMKLKRALSREEFEEVARKVLKG